MRIIEHEYDYKPQWLGITFGAVFFGFCAIFFAIKAQTINHGVLLDGLIELSIENATVFFWVLSLLSSMFVGASLYSMYFYARQVKNNRIEFASDAIIFPKTPMNPSVRVVEYRTISNLAIVHVKRIRILRVTYIGGSASISSSLVKSDATFDEISSMLAAKVQASRSDAVENRY